MEDKEKKYLKWGICGVAGLGIAIVAAPILAATAWSLVSGLIALVLGAGILLALPVLSELLSQALFWVYVKTIRGNPVQKLWRDLKDFGEEIEELNQNIEEVTTEEFEFEQQIKRNKDILGADRVLEWNERKDEITESKRFLIAQREELRILYAEMERDVRINEVEWNLGNAYNKAASAVNKATNIAGGTQGGKIAMDAIQHRLSEGRARLQTLRTKKSAGEIREIMKQRAGNGTATPAVGYSPSPSLPAPHVQPTPIPAAAGAVKGGFNSSLIDKI